MPQSLKGALVLALPPMRIGDEDTLVQRSLHASYQTCIARPLLALVVYGKPLILVLESRPEAEVEQVHGEDEGQCGIVFGFRVEGMVCPVLCGV